MEEDKSTTRNIIMNKKIITTLSSSSSSSSSYLNCASTVVLHFSQLHLCSELSWESPSVLVTFFLHAGHAGYHSARPASWGTTFTTHNTPCTPLLCTSTQLLFSSLRYIEWKKQHLSFEFRKGFKFLGERSAFFCALWQACEFSCSRWVWLEPSMKISQRMVYHFQIHNHFDNFTDSSFMGLISMVVSIVVPNEHPLKSEIFKLFAENTFPNSPANSRA